jgi:anti-sigma B factor antagonist
VSLSNSTTGVTSQDRLTDEDTAEASVPVPFQERGRGRGTSVGQTARVSVRRPEPGSVVVHICGEVDMASVPRLGELLRQRLRAAYLRTVVLDLSEVDFLGTDGLEMLLHVQRRAENRGVALYIVPDERCLSRLVQLTGTEERFCIRSSVAEAVAAS